MGLNMLGRSVLCVYLYLVFRLVSSPTNLNEDGSCVVFGILRGIFRAVKHIVLALWRCEVVERVREYTTKELLVPVKLDF